MNYVWLLVSLFVTLVSGLTIDPTWQIASLERAIDVTKSYLKERHDIQAVNVGSEPSKSFVFALPKDVMDNKAILVPRLTTPQVERSYLHPTVLENVEGGLSNVTYFSVQLPFPIAPKSSIRLSMSVISTNQIFPVPEYAPMGDKQSLQIKSPKYPLSPYPIQSYAMALIGAKEAHINFDKTIPEPVPFDVEAIEDTLVVNPTPGLIEPNTYIDMEIEYSRVRPLPYVTYLQRDFWVSHWGNVLQLEEYYELTNHGVKLDAGFNRAEWMNGGYPYRLTPAITNIPISLPDHPVSGSYYTDKVGNVSISQFVQDKLVLKPRFPVFGGWHYNFTVGWNEKLSDSLKTGADGEYIIQLKVVDGLVDCTYEKANFSVYLPEGAEYVDSQLPFQYDNLTISNEYSYLDVSSGRPKITFGFSNLVDELGDANIYVVYRYPQTAFIGKPLITSAYVLLALLGLYVLRRVNLSIKPATAKAKKED